MRIFPTKEKKRRLWYLFMLFDFCLLGIAAWHWLGPATRPEPIVEIKPGTKAHALAEQLARAKVVRSALGFRIYLRVTGETKGLKAGEYRFATPMTMTQVAAQLREGKTLLHPVTIPEGFTSWQVAERLAGKGFGSKEEYERLIHNPQLAKRLGLSAAGLEGYLFPDTYQLSRGMTPEQILSAMVERFHQAVTPEIFEAAQEQGLNKQELVILASIIQREVKAPEEQSKAASVFYNRLRRGMRLESCATVLYAQGRTAGKLDLADLEVPSPYNTYRRRGLPAGPIGNPGSAALRAAAFPDKTDYLFFVVGPQGRHTFTTTYADHLQAKRVNEKALAEAARP